MKFRRRTYKPIWPYLLISAVLCFLFYSTNYNGNWSYWADQELTLGYNGLLINSGYSQEYLDHPGFFSIHFISLLLKISYLMGFSQIQTITDFNHQQSIFSSMNYLVVVARHLALIFAIVTTSLAYFLAKQITQKKILSLLIAFLIFFSNGIFYHLTLTRTESFAFLFLIISIFLYLKAYQKNHSAQAIYLFLSLLFLFSAALNKAQVLIFVPFYFSWTYYFLEEKQSDSKLIGGDKLRCQIIAALSYFATVLLYVMQSNGLSLAFNLSIVTFFSVLNVVSSKKVGLNPYKSIAIFNGLYVLCYVSLDFISKMVNRGHSIFTNISDPVGMARFLPVTSTATIGAGAVTATLTIQEKLLSLFHIMSSPFGQLFNKITSPTVFLIFSITYMWYFRKTISRKTILFAIFCLLSFYIVAAVNSLRYENAYHYVLFSEFFLLSCSLVLIYQLPNPRVQSKIIGLLIFIILLVNLVPYTNYYNWLKRKGHLPFCTSGLVPYHKKMDVEKIEKECEITTTEK